MDTITATTDILLINRNTEDTEKLSTVLQTAGYTIHTAVEMRGALSALAGFPVGLIICDKDLEDISGDDFLGFIKKDPLRENIPFVFLVPLRDQGRPFRGFELGAADYMVYPMDAEMLLGRIAELAPPAGRENTAVSLPEVDRTIKAESESAQKNAAASPAPPAVDISRDGVIWMPCAIKRFERQQVWVETAFFGKSGVSVMIRFKQHDGTFIVNGRIKEVSLKDFQKPAELTIEVQDDNSWLHIHESLKQAGPIGQSGQEDGHSTDKEKPAPAEQDEIFALPFLDEEDSKAEPVQHPKPAQKKSSSYDIRFYHSIIGKQLDNYRAVTLIGFGNMGGVLQGWDVALEREVALKIISYQLTAKESFRELFIKEARVVSKLNHPNVAQIYHIGSANEILYYAMEFIDGVTLKQLINKEGFLDYDMGLDYLITLCEALETVSQNSIVHRDIKPANIMITTEGQIKLVDFGVAKTDDIHLGPDRKKGLMGTPAYMSPEQIARLHIDHRSDMYSLGATFYHAFCGSRPFEAKDLKSMLQLHMKGAMTPLCEKNKKIPSGLSDIIDKMMAKDPHCRYDSFHRLAAELNALRS